MIKNCERCDKLIDRHPNSKYCLDCAPIMAEVKSVEWKNKRPNKKKEYRRKSYLNNKEHTLFVNEQWRQKNWTKDKENKLRYHLKRFFNLTIEDYDNMVKEQKGLCKICNNPPDTKHNKLYVDHCHNTKKIRGLLCHGCNAGIGLLKDNTDILRKAIEYLDKNS